MRAYVVRQQGSCLNATSSRGSLGSQIPSNPTVFSGPFARLSFMVAKADSRHESRKRLAAFYPATPASPVPLQHAEEVNTDYTPWS